MDSRLCLVEPSGVRLPRSLIRHRLTTFVKNVDIVTALSGLLTRNTWDFWFEASFKSYAVR